ncbi:MAG: DNA-3-methyladenine glycosylase family protein [Chitinophagaceae bacterium]
MGYFQYLQKDKVLASILEQPLPTLQVKTNVVLYLIDSIIGQQLSTKVAATIFERFLHLFENKQPSTSAILQIPLHELKAIGLSEAKLHYVRNVALFWEEHQLNDAVFNSLSDDEIIDLLTQIKGVGNWTVAMLLIFCLGRPDVFSADDLGLKQAVVNLYGLHNKSPKELKTIINQIAANWAPYRSYAALHLWQWKDAIKKK